MTDGVWMVLRKSIEDVLDGDTTKIVQEFGDKESVSVYRVGTMVRVDIKAPARGSVGGGE